MPCTTQISIHLQCEVRPSNAPHRALRTHTKPLQALIRLDTMPGEAVRHAPQQYRKGTKALRVLQQYHKADMSQPVKMPLSGSETCCTIFTDLASMALAWLRKIAWLTTLRHYTKGPLAVKFTTKRLLAKERLEFEQFTFAVAHRDSLRHACQRNMTVTGPETPSSTEVVTKSLARCVMDASENPFSAFALKRRQVPNEGDRPTRTKRKRTDSFVRRGSAQRVGEHVPAKCEIPQTATATTEAQRAGDARVTSFGAIVDTNVEPHTLLCGTFPSIASLDASQCVC